MEKRNIPVKNYLILGILIIITIILTFYFVSWYKATSEYRENNSVITEVIGKIKLEEVDNYLLDNPNIVIYIASSKDNEVKDFEDDFKDFILKHEISDDIVYLDTDTVKDNNYQVLEKRFSNKLQLKDKILANKTNLLIVRDGKIIDVLYRDNKVINESDMTQFLEMYEVIEP